MKRERKATRGRLLDSMEKKGAKELKLHRTRQGKDENGVRDRKEKKVSVEDIGQRSSKKPEEEKIIMTSFEQTGPAQNKRNNGTALKDVPAGSKSEKLRSIRGLLRDVDKETTEKRRKSNFAKRILPGKLLSNQNWNAA